MNERIKALAVEADFMLCEDGHFYSECLNENITDHLEKFAELIVRECAKVAGDFEYARLHDSLVEDKIKEHFGGEE